jgi:hypothetical protein
MASQNPIRPKGSVYF